MTAERRPSQRENEKEECHNKKWKDNRKGGREEVRGREGGSEGEGRKEVRGKEGRKEGSEAEGRK